MGEKGLKEMPHCKYEDKMSDTKLCMCCLNEKPLSEFTKDKQKKDGLCSYCNICTRKKSKNYASTTEGYIVTLLCSAKGHSKSRELKDRLGAAEFDITAQDLKELWNNQGGLCYYSNIKMSTLQCSNWQASLERINDDKGYTKDNIVLCCTELNHVIHWSKEKVKRAVELSSSEYSLREHDYDEPKPKTGGKCVRREKKTINDVLYIKCNKCGVFKTEEEFYPNNSCIQCKKEYDKNLKETPRRHLMSLVNNAKQRVKKKKHRDLDLNITYEYIVEQYKKQGGRCAYSNIPMTFGSYLDKDWICSLERIDPLKGYVEGNVCLICYEFNTGDRTSVSKEENVTGSCAWTKEKFDYFVKTVTAA